MESKVIPPACFNFMTESNHLKRCRQREHLPQQDIAFLLGISPTHLVRYENGERNPTPEIIISYQILFGVSLKALFLPIFPTVKKNLLERSQRLIDQLKANPTPKSNYTISYLQNIVKSLCQETHDGK